MIDLLLLVFLVASFAALGAWVLANPETREHVFSTRDAISKDEHPCDGCEPPWTMAPDPRD